MENVFDNFLTKNRFTQLIQDTVGEYKISYLEAVIQVCELNNIEPEDSKKFISPVIKDKLEAEAKQLNFLPKDNTITFE
jgi:hypothetical protein